MRSPVQTVLLVVGFCFAQSILDAQATEAFDTPAGTPLNSTEAALGWSTGWKADHALTADLPMSYSVEAGSIDSIAFPKAAVGGKFFQEAASNLRMYRGLSNPIDWSSEGTYYIGFMAQWTGNSSSAASRVWIRLTDTGSRGDTVIGFIGDGSNNNQMLAHLRNSGTRVSGTTAYPGASNPADRDRTVIPYYVLAKITTVATGLDTISMSVFAPGDTVPTSEPLTWDLTAQRGRSDTTSVIGFDAQIFFGGRNAGFDKLRIADSYEDLIEGTP